MRWDELRRSCRLPVGGVLKASRDGLREFDWVGSGCRLLGWSLLDDMVCVGSGTGGGEKGGGWLRQVWVTMSNRGGRC